MGLLQPGAGTASGALAAADLQGAVGSQSPAPPATGGKSTRENRHDWQCEVQTQCKENFFSMRAVQHWSRGHKAVGFPSSEVFKSQLDKVLG